MIGMHVLGQAGMELTYPTAAHVALCSAPLAGTALISRQCLVYCCIKAVSPTFPSPDPKSQRAGGGKGVIAGTADPNSLKEYSIPYDVTFRNKTWRRKELPLRKLTITACTEIQLPKKWLNISCGWEAENNFFSFCFCVAFAFLTLNCSYLKPANVFFPHLIYSHFILPRRGEWESGCVVLSCCQCSTTTMH